MIKNNSNYTKGGDLYGMEFNINVPCEIRVNDIIISKNYLSGVTGPEILNQYIVKSGKQKVSIKVQHPYMLDGGLFTNDALKSIMDGIYIQLIKPENEYSVKTIKELKFPQITEKVASFAYEWNFDANVPYILSSWDDAQNLKNIDQDELKRQVIEKYQQLWNMLQLGKLDEFMQEINDSNNDLFMSNYFDESRKVEYLNNLRTFYDNHKGSMISMENSNIVLLADGKGVALEQIGKFNGLGLLIAKGKTENSFYTNYIILVKSIKTGNFKIQLINSEFIKYK